MYIYVIYLLNDNHVNILVLIQLQYLHKFKGYYIDFSCSIFNFCLNI